MWFNKNFSLVLGKQEQRFARLISSCAVYCMERALSGTRMMWILLYGTDLNNWTLPFGSSHFTIWSTFLWQFPTPRFTLYRKNGLELLSSHCRQKHFQQCFITYRLQSQVRLAWDAFQPLQQLSVMYKLWLQRCLADSSLMVKNCSHPVMRDWWVLPYPCASVEIQARYWGRPEIINNRRQLKLR